MNDDEAADRRWSAAAELATGTADVGMSRRRSRTWTFVVVLLAVSMAAGVIFALLIAPQTTGSTSAGGSEQKLIVQLVFLGLGLLVGIGGFIWARRHGYYITRWRHAASPLTRAEKKRARRQIAGKEDPDLRLPIVVAIARQDRRATLGVAPIYAALVLFAISTAVGTDVFLIKLIDVAVVVLFLFVAIQLAIAYRRAGRFIAVYGDHHLTAPAT